jgi:hypothetical protein
MVRAAYAGITEPIEIAACAAAEKCCRAVLAVGQVLAAREARRASCADSARAARADCWLLLDLPLP